MREVASRFIDATSTRQKFKWFLLLVQPHPPLSGLEDLQVHATFAFQITQNIEHGFIPSANVQAEPLLGQIHIFPVG